MAIGAIRCIFDHALKVPDDIAVMGLDNIKESAYLVPSLSTVDSLTKEKCRIISNELIKKITGKSVNYNVNFPCKLILRESTRFQISEKSGISHDLLKFESPIS